MDQTKSPAGVVIFVVWRKMLFMLLRDNKPGLPFANMWTPPTGGLEHGEDLEECGEREAREELSFLPKSLRILGVSAKGNGFFFARLTDKEMASIRLSEGQGMGFFTFEALGQVPIGGALEKYLSRYPEVIQRMLDTGKAPAGNELGLAVWNKM